MATFGERLKLLMDSRGLNQHQLALKSGLTEAAISRYLSGERQPRMATVSSLSKALSIPAWELMDENPTEVNQVDDAIRLIARNAHDLTPDQRERIIKVIAGK